MDVMNILVIDDQQETLDLIREALSGMGHNVLAFSDPVEALKVLEDRRVDLVLTDVRMPQMDGLEVLHAVKTRSPETEVILLTAFGDIEMAVQAMKQGAADFFNKPLQVAALTGVVGKLLELQSVRRRLRDLSGDEVTPVGTGESMQRVLALARAVAETDATVLILGATGSGKEVLANYIQRHSGRASGPFVKVNCAALPETLLESELFGHEKGSFTGAADRHVGRFERAHRGTVFLDEIAEVPLPMQVRLLRVLQEREIERIGGTQGVPVDFRLICATHRNLEQRVAEGKFREDLYYRIQVFPIRIPLLRERIEDLPALAGHFLRRAHAKLGRGPLEIHPSAVALLQQYPWPGNVRELENVIERACVLARGNTLMPKQISAFRHGTLAVGAAAPGVAAADGGVARASSPCATYPHRQDAGATAPGVAAAAARAGSALGPAPPGLAQPGPGQVLPAAGPAAAGPSRDREAAAETPLADARGSDALPRAAFAAAAGAALPWSVDVENPLEEAEKATLQLVLGRCGWNFKQAASTLKLSRSTLYAKASHYGLARGQ